MESGKSRRMESGKSSKRRNGGERAGEPLDFLEIIRLRRPNLLVPGAATLKRGGAP